MNTRMLGTLMLLLSGSWIVEAEESAVLSPKQVTELVHSIRSTKTESEILSGLQRLGQSSLKPVPAQVTTLLVEQSILNDSADVRKTAAIAMRKLNDENAARVLFEGAMNDRWKPDQRKRAAEDLRFVDNPIVVEKLVTIATTLILRTGTAQFQNLDTVFIKAPDPTGGTGNNFGSGNGQPPNEDQDAHGAAINNPIRLPIELPTIELTSVNTALQVLAVEALKTIAKRDIGPDPMRWKDWFADWKVIRDVRVAQASDQ